MPAAIAEPRAAPGQVGEAEIARERHRRLVDEPLEPVGESLGVRVDEVLDGMEHLELVRQALGGRHLGHGLPGELRELEELGIGDRSERVGRGTEDHEDVGAHADCRDRVAVVRAEDLPGTVLGAAQHAVP